MSILDTDRLLLRPASDNDLVDLYLIRSDPKVCKYESYLPYNLCDTKLWLQRIKHDPRSFVIQHKLDDKVIGYVGWYKHNKRQLLCIDLASTYWGIGYAAEALEEVLAHFHVTEKVDGGGLRALVDVENIGSLKLFGKFGFVEAGRLRMSTEKGMRDSVCLKLVRPGVDVVKAGL